jgi:hypothetical protein
MPQGPPIQVLARADGSEHVVTPPLVLAFELFHGDIEHGKDEIAAAELCFAPEKRSEFKPAMLTVDRARRHDRDEENRPGYRAPDLVLPERALGDRGRVLPEAEISSELQPQFAENPRAQPRQGTLRMLVVAARVAEKTHKFRKIGQGRHRQPAGLRKCML